MKKLKIVDKRRFAMSSAVLLAIIVAALLLSGGKADKQAYVEDTVVVHKGDTLWGIADMYCPEGMDKREYIRTLEVDNDCSANIRAGQVLTVRVYE